MNSEHSGIAMPHAWVENVLMDVMLYCMTNGLDRLADAVEPALAAAKVLNAHHAPPEAIPDGARNAT